MLKYEQVDSRDPQQPPAPKFSLADMARWRNWPGVESVEPFLFFIGEIQHGPMSRIRRVSVLPGVDEIVALHLVAGRLPDRHATDEILVDEAQVYEWGFHDEARMPEALGTAVELAVYPVDERFQIQSLITAVLQQVDELSADELKSLQEVRMLRGLDIRNLVNLSGDQQQILERILDRHPELRPAERAPLVRQRFRVVGVFRRIEQVTGPYRRTLGGFSFEKLGALLSPAAAVGFLQSQLDEKVALIGAHVVVASEIDLRTVVEALQAEGHRPESLLEIVERIRSRIELVAAMLSTLAGAAVVLSALGIAKSVASSIVERTKEIAIMKAIGAEDGQVRRLFLVEGALLGSLGGGLGLLLGWLTTRQLDAWVRGFLERRLRQPVTDDLFIAPWWLWLSVPLIVTAVAILAGLLPSRRATRIEPALALRYE